MKVTFPHLGSMHIFCKAIAETAGIPYIVPPETSRKTLTLGVLHSNECICLPFKIILGNLIEALQMGADTIVMVGSGPPCRLGLYDLVQKVILEDMGLHYRWLTIPPRFSWQAMWKNHEETKELRKELSAKNVLFFPYGLWMGWKKMMACEALERLAMKVRPLEIKRGETQGRLKKALSWVDEAKTASALEGAIRKGKTLLQEMERDSTRIPFKVAIVGELYTVMDPHINRGVEQKLGELGVEVTRTSWFSTHILRSLRKNKADRTSERIRFFEASKAYLGYDVGAECNISIGEAILRSEEGYDGVVHLMPFACMPETTASGILTQVGKDRNIPILTLVLDEQEIEGRIQTLLEAFVEMLEWKRRAA
ncbi:MAG TPA: 2-hydroxyacyl-CoA dehydratase [Thermodesulfobacteriota bacterium]|nr:2-hydroxyacyl-CoA dehydratase [Thermodesulfobacteriota bacterium]